MKHYFTDIAKKLDLKQPYKNSPVTDVDCINSNFENHISIKKIQKYSQGINYGDFIKASLLDIEKEILYLNLKKSSTNYSTPTTVLRQSAEIHLPYLTKSINHMFTKCDFSKELKNSEVISVYKKRTL